MHEQTGSLPLVRHHIAGGAEHGGGIGRLAGYVLAQPTHTMMHVVTDTRGPRFDLLRSPWRLLNAMALIGADSLRGGATIQHLHIAGRGSTTRKLVLGAWARLLGAPYILHLHDYAYAEDLARRPLWQLRAIRTLFQGAEHVIVLGRRDRATVRAALEVPGDRITVLRNCVPEPGPDRPSQDGPVRILFLGQLGPRKGVPELLAALADPQMPSGTWQATLAGDGPVERYREEAAHLGLAGRVRMPGWVDGPQAAQLRAEADILVLPSHAEGFAMAVLEGLAQGLAVVTTRVGAHDEVLIDDENCLLVPPGDAPSLAHALARLVGSRALRARIGKAGRRLYVDQFGMAGYVEALERLQADTLRDLSPIAGPA